MPLKYVSDILPSYWLFRLEPLPKWTRPTFLIHSYKCLGLQQQQQQQSTKNLFGLWDLGAEQLCGNHLSFISSLSRSLTVDCIVIPVSKAMQSRIIRSLSLSRTYTHTRTRGHEDVNCINQKLPVPNAPSLHLSSSFQLWCSFFYQARWTYAKKHAQDYL